MAEADDLPWRPGSFTKNFSWGSGVGLRELYTNIRIGFDEQPTDVPRATYQARVSAHARNWHIPLNFFLFNKQVGGIDTVVVDELVFQALSGEAGERFDKLALFALNLSLVGTYKGASAEQRRPAVWARHYVRDRVASEFKWNDRLISANDIQAYLQSSGKWKAEGSRKVATNLNFLYKVGKLTSVATPQVERWWVDAVFLALDRIIEDRVIDGKETTRSDISGLLRSFEFETITGGRSLEKSLALNHVARLYFECGGRNRFSEEAVRERTHVQLKDILEYIGPNSPDPIGAIHPTNPRILKTIPPACAMLARYAGFDVIDAMSLDSFSIEHFVKTKTRDALDRLRREGIEPTMTAEELLRLTRGK